MMKRFLWWLIVATLAFGNPALAQVDPAARGLATQARTLALGRIANMQAAIGDSRVAAIYQDPANRIYSARSPLNWANATLDSRLIIESFGKSGDRTDQARARIDAAIATGAGGLYIQLGVNNLAAVASSGNFTYTHAVTGEIITITTVARSAADDIIWMAERGRAAGMYVVIEQEVGSGDLTTAEKQAALMDLRAYIAAYARATPKVYLHDAMPIVMQSAAMAYKAGYAYDLTHVNPRGAYFWGKSLARLYAQLVPNSWVPLVSNVVALPATGRRQLLVNPIFATATGGTVGANVTGTVPAGWEAQTTNAATTATAGTVADANGIGNNVTLAMNFGAAGHLVRFNQSYGSPGSVSTYPAPFQVGDLVEAVAKIEVTDAASVLSAAYLYFSVNTGAGGTSFDNATLFGLGEAANQGPGEPYVVTIRTRPFRIPPTVGNGPFVVTSVRFTSSAAGTANVKIHQVSLRRLP